jgi:cell division protein FtsB
MMTMQQIINPLASIKMEEDVDQIAQLQARNNALYATIAALRQEIAVLRERITAAQIGIMLLNQTLEEHDRALYNVRLSYRILQLAHEHLLRRRNNV